MGDAAGEDAQALQLLGLLELPLEGAPLRLRPLPFGAVANVKPIRISVYLSTFLRLMKLLRSKPRVLKNDSRSVESQRTEVYTFSMPWSL